MSILRRCLSILHAGFNPASCDSKNTYQSIFFSGCRSGSQLSSLHPGDTCHSLESQELILASDVDCSFQKILMFSVAGHWNAEGVGILPASPCPFLPPSPSPSPLSLFLGYQNRQQLFSSHSDTKLCGSPHADTMQGVS